METSNVDRPFLSVGSLGPADDRSITATLGIMMTARAQRMSETATVLRNDPRVGDIAADGLEKLCQLFGGRANPGVDMAGKALAGSLEEDRAETSPLPSFASV